MFTSNVLNKPKHSELKPESPKKHLGERKTQNSQTTCYYNANTSFSCQENKEKKTHDHVVKSCIPAAKYCMKC